MTAILWETQIPSLEKPLWLLEWQAPAAPRRSLHLIMDTTDSCLKHGETMKPIVRKALATLEPGDKCTLWMMGPAQPAGTWPVNDASSRGQELMCDALWSSLCEIKGGTWLSDTFSAVKQSVEQETDSAYLLIITDGEIFDREAPGLLKPPDFSLAVLYVDYDDPPSDTSLFPWGKGWKPDQFGYDAFFKRPDTGFQIDTDDRRQGGIFAFALDGKATARSEFPEVVAGQWLRLAFVGGPRPVLRIASGRKKRELNVVSHPLRDAHLTRRRKLEKVCRRIEGLHLVWRRDVLNRLAQNTNDSFCCQSCSAPFKPKLTRQAFCSHCGALLIAWGTAYREDALLKDAIRLVFPMNSQGEVLLPPVKISAPHSLEHWYGVVKEGTSRSFCVFLEKRRAY